MGIVVKAYTFIQDTVFDASSVNRNFDDLYDEFNGSINSANIASTFTLAGSAVSITDTASNYAATEVEAALGEAAENITYNVPKITRGFNSLHVLTQRSSGIIILPGKVEINESVYVIDDRITIASPTLISGSFSMNALYGLAVHITATGTVVTASDFCLIPYADVSASKGINETKNGYYFSETYRVIHVLSNLHSASDTMRLYHHQTLGQMDAPLKLRLQESEAGMHGFNTAGGVTITPSSTIIVMRHSAENETYDYSIMGSQTGSLTLNLPPFFGYATDTFFAMGYYLASVQWYINDGTYRPVQYQVTGTGAFSNYMYLFAENTNYYKGPKLSVVGSQAGPYFAELKRIPVIGLVT